LGGRNNKQFNITSARSGMQTFVPEISKVTAAGLSDPVIRVLIDNSLQRMKFSWKWGKLCSAVDFIVVD